MPIRASTGLADLFSSISLRLVDLTHGLPVCRLVTVTFLLSVIHQYLTIASLLQDTPLLPTIFLPNPDSWLPLSPGAPISQRHLHTVLVFYSAASLPELLFGLLSTLDHSDFIRKYFKWNWQNLWAWEILVACILDCGSFLFDAQFKPPDPTPAGFQCILPHPASPSLILASPLTHADRSTFWKRYGPVVPTHVSLQWELRGVDIPWCSPSPCCRGHVGIFLPALSVGLILPSTALGLCAASVFFTCFLILSFPLSKVSLSSPPWDVSQQPSA